MQFAFFCEFRAAVEIISERISIVKKEGLLSIVILPTKNRAKLGLMFLWLFAWTVCGIIVFANYFQATTRDAKLFIIVYLAFWAYFEVAILRAYVWKKYGREKLWVQRGRLHYQRETYGKGKVRSYLSDMISGMRLVEIRAGNFFDQLSQSFFMRGGERIEFTFQGKVVRAGMQLTDEEALSVMRELNRFLPEAGGRRAV